MTPALASLLSDVRLLLRSIQYLFSFLPPERRTAHIEGRVSELVARIDAVVPTPEPTKEREWIG